MADKYTLLLERLDPIGIARYQISVNDLKKVERYVNVLQSSLAANVWDEATSIVGEYGTSIIIHEITEFRGLVRNGIQPLRENRRSLQRILNLHVDVHVFAVYEEHLYLQEALIRKYGQRFEVATLIRANQLDDRDLNLLLESQIGIFLFEAARVSEARQTIERLKGR